MKNKSLYIAGTLVLVMTLFVFLAVFQREANASFDSCLNTVTHEVSLFEAGTGRSFTDANGVVHCTGTLVGVYNTITKETQWMNSTGNSNSGRGTNTSTDPCALYGANSMLCPTSTLSVNMRRSQSVPTITMISVDGIPVSSVPRGTNITITGSNFSTLGTIAKFAGTVPTQYTPTSISSNGTSMVVNTSYMSAGDYNVSIQNVAFGSGSSVATLQKPASVNSLPLTVTASGEIVYNPTMTGIVSTSSIVATTTRTNIPTTTITPPSNNPVLACYVFSNNLGNRSTGVDVVALQTWLIENGFDIPLITVNGVKKGYYSSNTAAAVRAYQLSVGLSATGVFDPATRQKVNESCGNAQFPNTSSVSTSSVQGTVVNTNNTPTQTVTSTHAGPNSSATVNDTTPVTPTPVLTLTPSVAPGWSQYGTVSISGNTVRVVSNNDLDYPAVKIAWPTTLKSGSACQFVGNMATIWGGFNFDPRDKLYYSQDFIPQAPGSYSIYLQCGTQRSNTLNVDVSVDTTIAGNTGSPVLLNTSAIACSANQTGQTNLGTLMHYSFSGLPTGGVAPYSYSLKIGSTLSYSVSVPGTVNKTVAASNIQSAMSLKVTSSDGQTATVPCSVRLSQSESSYQFASLWDSLKVAFGSIGF